MATTQLTLRASLKSWGQGSLLHNLHYLRKCCENAQDLQLIPEQWLRGHGPLPLPCSLAQRHPWNEMSHGPESRQDSPQSLPPVSVSSAPATIQMIMLNGIHNATSLAVKSPVGRAMQEFRNSSSGSISNTRFSQIQPETSCVTLPTPAEGARLAKT